VSEQGTGPAHPEPEVGAISASPADGPEVEASPAVERTEPLEPVESVGAEPAAQPTPVVGAGDATADRPAGTAHPLHAAPAPIGEERPEVLVGAAFGGGIVAALVLKSLARRKQR
jgi:hypothetical protein